MEIVKSKYHIKLTKIQEIEAERMVFEAECHRLALHLTELKKQFAEQRNGF